MKIRIIKNTPVLLLCSSLLCGVETIKAQSLDPSLLGIPQRIIAERDINEKREIEDDIEFNSSTIGVLVDGQFIKDDIGIDLYETRGTWLPGPPFWIKGVGSKNDSLYVDIHRPDTVMVHGMPVTLFVSYRYNKKNVKWVSLSDVQKEFCPDAEGTIIYMINKFFITKHDDLYKLDRDYILNVETFDSKEFEMLKDFPPFTIIRIFTKTQRNWHWEGKL